MSRPKLFLVNSEQPDTSRPSREGKRYRFDLSRKKFIFCVTSLVVTLCWMFILGILVGRGIALVSSEDFSVRAGFFRFLGLGKEAGQPAPRAAETWGDPKKMLESLNYYEDLTHKSVNSAIAPPLTTTEDDSSGSSAAPPAAVIPQPEPVKEGPPKRQAAQVQPQVPVEKTTKAAPPPASVAGEQFTLLVASLKEPENAQRLIDQLALKGYSPRLETLDLHGGGRWSRVLVGSFLSREAALKFAAEFNRKENMEGLVIREAN